MHQSVFSSARLINGLTACALVVGLGLGAMTVGAQTIKVDPKLDTYRRTGGVSGNLDSIGSDTLNNLMTFWAEGFRKVYPNVNIQIEGKGSSTAPPALAEGTSQLGPMSREMKDKELQAFEKKFGYKPTRVGVALDSLAIFVNKDNPIKGMSMPQVDAVFSANRKLGYKENVTTWGQLGMSGSWIGRPISLYGRNSASGTYGFFKEKALGKGDYKNEVKEQPGSSAVVQGVTSDRSAMGYSGIGYSTSGVRAIPLSKEDGGTLYEADYANVLSGKYPLGRMLYIYVDKAPNKPLNPLVREFLTYALSREGQEVVVKDGYLPLPARIAKRQMSLLQ